MSGEGEEFDVLVVGGGLAGAMAALSANELGARVVLVRRSPGATALSSGAVGVAPDFTTAPGERLSARRGPVESARRLAAMKPDHPYSLLGEGLDRLPEALAFAARELGSLLVPALERPRLLATPYGTLIGCGLCQRSMEQGDLLIVKGTLSVIGFKGHLGFDARLVAAGLARFEPRGGPPVVAGEVALPAFGLETANSYALARALEEPGAAEALGKELRAGLSARTGAVLLPPVLGLAPDGALWDRVREAAGLPVAETLSDVPSVPGARLEAAIRGRLEVSGISIVEGNLAGGGPGTPAMVAGRSLHARSWVLATGRFVGGGITRKGALAEPVLGLPVQAAEGRESGVHLSRRPAQALTTRDRRASQPLLSAGLRAGADLRPLDERGRPVFDRLFVAGAVLGGHEQATDGTGLGVAILTGFLAGRMAAGEGSKTAG